MENLQSSRSRFLTDEDMAEIDQIEDDQHERSCDITGGMLDMTDEEVQEKLK